MRNADIPEPLHWWILIRVVRQPLKLHGCAPAMETSLHRALKQVYADQSARLEVPLGRYRIDVVANDGLIEIQHGSLAAIRDKIGDLVHRHDVTVVKPIVIRKRIIRRSEKGGRVLGKRLSPKRGSVIDFFDELVYFKRVFPHPNLSLEVPLVDIEEWRFPGHGRRRRRRKNDHQVEDQKLIEIREIYRFRTGGDLLQLIPNGLPKPFHTGHLADQLGIQRWHAQKIAYCLRNAKAIGEVGKLGNSRLYTVGARTAA